MGGPIRREDGDEPLQRDSPGRQALDRLLRWYRKWYGVFFEPYNAHKRPFDQDEAEEAFFAHHRAHLHREARWILEHFHLDSEGRLREDPE